MKEKEYSATLIVYQATLPIARKNKTLEMPLVKSGVCVKFFKKGEPLGKIEISNRGVWVWRRGKGRVGDRNWETFLAKFKRKSDAK